MRRSKKLISLILSTMLVFSSIGAATQASAADFSLDGIKASVSAAAKPVLIKVLETVVTGLLGAINGTIKDNPAYNSEEDYVSEDFYSGSGPFISTPSADATWKLGSAEVSLVPKDILEKDYYLGGFIMIENGFTNRVEEVIDDMKARVIAIDDNSGRGVSLFATIDCIGMTNYDIRSIRKLVAEKFTEKYPFAHLASVNVFSTHTHSCIDTEGLWTNLFGKLFKNLGVSLFRTEDPAQGGKGGILDSILSSSLVSGAVGKVKDVGSKLVGTELEKGTDQDYMSFLFEQVSDAMLSAYSSMKPGKMTYAVKDIGRQYFNNKNRPTASSIDTRLTRLTFTPNDGSKGTIIANMGAHPDIAGLPTSDKENKGRSLTGDYIYYMGEFINKAGYNFMFFNGAICGIYCGRGPVGDARPSETKGRWEETRRYGYEVARMTLGMTMTLSEIEQDPLLYNEEEITADREYTESREGTYTLWCENWEPVSQVQVEPFFNIMLREVELEITNPLMSIAGKLNLANYNVYKTAEGAYKIRTEVGYMEFGNQLKVAMAPGEFCSDLVAGGTSLTAEGSTSGKDFESKPLTEIFGEGITVFGLANDAIGYIVPDNDYSLAIAFDHYQELISLGKGTASAVMEGFAAIAESI